MASVRAIKSLPPPGAKGDTMRTGFPGYDGALCAKHCAQTIAIFNASVMEQRSFNVKMDADLASA
jgi:hypothetical protein